MQATLDVQQLSSNNKRYSNSIATTKGTACCMNVCHVLNGRMTNSCCASEYSTAQLKIDLMWRCIRCTGRLARNVHCAKSCLGYALWPSVTAPLMQQARRWQRFSCVCSAITALRCRIGQYFTCTLPLNGQTALHYELL